MTKKVLVIEDHSIVAAGVANLIRQEFQGYEVVIAGTFPDGLETLKHLQPIELVILDVQLPGSESVRMLSLLRDVQPGVRILIFTALEDPRRALSFLSAGANGFVSKTLDLPVIASSIRTVLNDKRYMTDEVQQTVAESFFQNLAPSSVYDDINLSPREKEVLDLLLQGKRTKDISEQLRLKLTTVSSHKARVFEKLRVGNIVELVTKYKS